MDHPFSADHSPRPFMFSTQALHQSYPAQSPPQSQSSFLNQVHPISITHKSPQANTFVHKLYNMVIDTHFQHLIAWNYTGTSFIVCNIMEFSRDVLPKHFKHNNFSSFVRQLNMYGFHKVNKSPRGHKTLAENQIWEFSHSKFLRERPDLLDDIKRKTLESDNVRRETGDLHAHMAMMQVSQSDMLQQLNHLYDSFNQLNKDLEETKQKQKSYNKLAKTVMQYVSQQNGGQLPPELSIEYKNLSIYNDNNTHNSDHSRSSSTHKHNDIFVSSHHHYQPSSGTSIPPTSSSNPSTDSLLHRIYSGNTNQQGRIIQQQPLVPTQTKNNQVLSSTHYGTLPSESSMVLDKNHFFPNNSNVLPHNHNRQSTATQAITFDCNETINSPTLTSPNVSHPRPSPQRFSFLDQQNSKMNG